MEVNGLDTAIAGSNIEKAVLEPGAVAVLIEFDADVRHYDVIEEVRSPYTNRFGSRPAV